jgi:hypothetical protein
MRFFVSRFLLLILLPLLACPVHAEENGDQVELLTKASRLDAYFQDLKRTRDPAKASDLTTKIWSEWNQSGSATVDLLLQWARDAMNKKRYPVALDFLDQATTLAPDYAEG